MFTMYLYLTIFMAWGTDTVSPDSIGAQPYFSSDDHQNCYIYDADIKIIKCIKAIEIYDKKRCNEAASKFAIKHKQPKEPCNRMKVKVYTEALVQSGKVTYQLESNSNTPVCGGHKCKKNRKGKLYACIKYKDSCP